MNSMNDERFFELAMKVIARQATAAERAELDTRFAREPDLRAEFERLQHDVQTAKEALPLVEATQSTAGELPGYARGRLQTKVRQTLGRPAEKSEPDRSVAWGWRWFLGVAAVTAVVLIVALPIFRTPTEPVIQLAILDTVGSTRGYDTNEVAILREMWSSATLNSFTNAAALREWGRGSPSNCVRIIYDRAAAEVRVRGNWKGATFENTFLVETELASALKEAMAFITEQTKR